MKVSDTLGDYLDALWFTEEDRDMTENMSEMTYQDIFSEHLSRLDQELWHFLDRANRLCERYEVTASDRQLCHDFWLTRQGTGCGFNDGDWGHLAPFDRLITALAQRYKELDVYVSDGEIRIMQYED